VPLPAEASEDLLEEAPSEIDSSNENIEEESKEGKI
jgi:hypothetical protein